MINGSHAPIDPFAPNPLFVSASQALLRVLRAKILHRVIAAFAFVLGGFGALGFASPSLAHADFIYGRALYMDDRTYFLLDEEKTQRKVGEHAYTMPNQVFVLSARDGQLFCSIDRKAERVKSPKLAQRACLSQNSKNMIVRPSMRSTLIALDSLSPQRALPLIYKRYGFHHDRYMGDVALLFERNGSTQIGWGESNDGVERIWFDGFYELVLMATAKQSSAESSTKTSAPTTSANATDTQTPPNLPAMKPTALTLYAALSTKSRAILQGVFPSPSPESRAKPPKKSLPQPEAQVALLEREQLEGILGDRIALIAYEKPYYQAVVIRHESVYFWGYVHERAIKALLDKSQARIIAHKGGKEKWGDFAGDSSGDCACDGDEDATSDVALDPAMLPHFARELFSRQYVFSELFASYGGKLPDSGKSAYIKVEFDAKTQRIALIDTSLLPYLPISQEIDYYLGESARAELLSLAQSRGKPSMSVWLRLEIDSTLLQDSSSYVWLEPAIKLINLSVAGSAELEQLQGESGQSGFAILQNSVDFPAESNMDSHARSAASAPKSLDEASESRDLCIGGNMLYRRYLEIFTDENLGSVQEKIDKFALAQGNLVQKLPETLSTTPKSLPSMNPRALAVEFTPKSSAATETITGYIRSDDMAECKDVDLDSSPEYARAATMLAAIEQLQRRRINPTTQVLMDGSVAVGYIYEGFRSFAGALQFAESIAISPIELISLEHKTTTKAHKYGGDRHVSYDRDYAYRKPARADIIFLDEILDEFLDKSQNLTRASHKSRKKIDKSKQIQHRVLFIHESDIFIISEHELVYVKV